MTEQEKSEKVIKGLECCREMDNPAGWRVGGCWDCPYEQLKGEEGCAKTLKEDALALLKAQETVVMAGAELTDAELIEKIRKAPIFMKPIVDAAPVAHGRWVKVPGYVTPGGDPVWKCSECGKGVHVYGIEHGSYGAEIADGQWISCPNCGAKMDGDGDG